MPLRAPRKRPEPKSPSPWSTISQAESVSPRDLGPESLNGVELTNIRLMHHFATSTCQTLATKRDLKVLWRVKIPGLAFEHHYLLQMILAVSALHMFREPHSGPSHMAYALELYEASLKNSSMVLSQISPSNCDALYAFSVLALVFEFGSLHRRESLLYNRDGSLAHWIINSRGIHAIIGSSWNHLASGVLKPMLQCSFHEAGPANIEKHLQEFSSHIQGELLPATAHIYLQTLSELIRWSRLVNSGFYGWLCHFTREYGDLLSRKDPYALIIFGYACVVLKCGEPVYWIDGCPEKLIREIYDYLNTSLRVWLHWPMAQLGVGW